MVLRGLGASLALPLLDGMVPALAAMRNSPANPVRRLGVVYVPNGMRMEHWTPSIEGAGFDFGEVLQPLEPFRDHLRVLTGLDGAEGTGLRKGVHASASTRFLTGVPATSADGADLLAGASMDQLAARELGRHTQLASLELALDGRDFTGSCDDGFSLRLHQHDRVGQRDNPAADGETTRGSCLNGSSATAARLTRSCGARAGGKTPACSIRSPSGRPSSSAGSGPAIGRSSTSILDGVRDIERRIQKAEEQSARELPSVEQPPGVPDTLGEHAKLMFDLQALAYETDLTRVVTFMIGREITGRTYAEIGVPDAHHPISHHQRDPEKLEKLTKINRYHVTLFAAFLERLRATPDGDGSLLGPRADHLRRRHVREQLAPADQPADFDRGWRRTHGRASSHVRPGHSAGQPAPEPARPAGCAGRDTRPQHRPAADRAAECGLAARGKSRSD